MPTAPELQPAAEGASIELSNVGVSFPEPTERIGSFKEWALARLRGPVAKREFPAVDDVSLTVERGEVFGIVGRNGAGKSTLLKVIARVLHPGRGRVVIRGQVSPLLELGAGFHAELSGRENVFLNGAILGHSREDIAERFDEIVEWAGIARFIDSPLRTYSSGMAARLGFSMATAHRPDVLLLDEHLSVGDTEFQDRCKERLREFNEQGTTVVVVSHSLRTVSELCSRAAWLEHGRLEFLGPTEKALERYLEGT